VWLAAKQCEKWPTVHKIICLHSCIILGSTVAEAERAKICEDRRSVNESRSVQSENKSENKCADKSANKCADNEHKCHNKSTLQLRQHKYQKYQPYTESNC